MKLSKDTVTLILQSAKLAHMLGIGGLIFDSKGIRGYNDDEGVILAALGNHDFEFESLGLARLDSLKNKASLIKETDNIKVNAVPRKGKEEVIEKLEFDCGKIKFEFRCALTKSLTDVPSTKMNIKPLHYFEITPDDVTMISKGVSAMRSKVMTIRGNGSDVEFRFSDDTGDMLNFKVDSELTSEDDSDMSLTVNISKMLPIFKLAGQAENFRLNILKNNILHISIMDMDVIVMPEV
jgi:hypothetical protein